MLKLSLDKSKVSLSFSDETPAVPSYSFYEYHWDGPKRSHVPVWQPRQTTLLVVFDGESSRLFSTTRILLYYSNGSPKDARSGNVWVRLVADKIARVKLTLLRTGHSTTWIHDPLVQRPSSTSPSKRPHSPKTHGRVRSHSRPSDLQVVPWGTCPSVPSLHPGTSPQIHHRLARSRAILDVRHAVSLLVLYSLDHALHPNYVVGMCRTALCTDSPRFSDRARHDTHHTRPSTRLCSPAEDHQRLSPHGAPHQNVPGRRVPSYVARRSLVLCAGLPCMVMRHGRPPRPSHLFRRRQVESFETALGRVRARKGLAGKTCARSRLPSLYHRQPRQVGGLAAGGRRGVPSHPPAQEEEPEPGSVHIGSDHDSRYD